MYNFNHVSRETSKMSEDQIRLATGETTIVEDTQKHYNDLTRIIKVLDRQNIFMCSQNPACMVYTKRNMYMGDDNDGNAMWEEKTVDGQLLELKINEIIYLAKKDIMKPQIVIDKYIEKGIRHIMHILPDFPPPTSGSDKKAINDYMLYISKAVELLTNAVQQKKNILVHCADGDSFAPLIIICFMMFKVDSKRKAGIPVDTKGQSLARFFHGVLYAKRKTIFLPNTEYFSLLTEWEAFLK